jgi:hypothetical protein
MNFEFGGVEVDPSGVRDGITGRAKTASSTYAVDMTSHDPPPGYRVGASPEGAIEIACPRISFGRALLTGALLLLFAAWPVGWWHEGHGVLAVVSGAVVASCWLELIAGVLVQTSWVVSDHWLLRRRVLWGFPAWETEFAVDSLEIDNAQWRTGRGSTDTLRLLSPPPACARVKVRETNDDSPRARRERVVAELGRGPIAANILQLGRFLAHHANVPLEVTVRQISEPD